MGAQTAIKRRVTMQIREGDKNGNMDTSKDGDIEREV